MGCVDAWSWQDRYRAGKSRKGFSTNTSVNRASKWQVKPAAKENDSVDVMVGIVKASHCQNDNADMSTSSDGSDEEFKVAVETQPAIVVATQPELVKQDRPKEELAAEIPSIIGASFASTEFDGLTGDELIGALATIYSTITSLAKESTDKKDKTRFHSVRAPPIGVHAYISRLHSYFQCSDACLLTSLVYIDRIIKMNPAFEVSDLSIHRLLATTLVLSAKFNDDVYYSNAYYSKVCGLTLKEMNMLEATLLKFISWKVHVTTEEYQEYYSRVSVASQGFKSGAGLN